MTNGRQLAFHGRGCPSHGAGRDEARQDQLDEECLPRLSTPIPIIRISSVLPLQLSVAADSGFVLNARQVESACIVSNRCFTKSGSDILCRICGDSAGAAASPCYTSSGDTTTENGTPSVSKCFWPQRTLSASVVRSFRKSLVLL